MTADDPARLEARLAALTLPEKVRLLTGRDLWTLAPLPAAGLASIVTSDGPNGVRGTTWDERDTSLLLPNPTALAATWDVALINRVGEIFGHEARRRGVNVLLGPTINLHRTPIGGRHFENLSEDPRLTGELGAAYVSGVQSAGVAATPKHYVGNESETERLTYDAGIDERTLREVYLAPFEEVVRRAGAWVVMAAYNGVNGHTMTEHDELINGVLKGEWGFDGVLVSDWLATRTTAPSALAGLDLAMPGPGGPWGDALVAAVRAGEVPAELIDDKVRRILLLAARTGALTPIPTDQPSADQPTADSDVPAVPPPPADASAEIRALSARTMVLLRNDSPADGARPLLPLDPAVRRVALIGESALRPAVQGGGSARLSPPHVVTPVDGLRRALPDDVELVVRRGVRHRRQLDPIPVEEISTPDGVPGFRIEFRAADGDVLATETRAASHLVWAGTTGLPAETASVTMRGALRVQSAGHHEFAIYAASAATLDVNGIRVLDVDLTTPPEDMMVALTEPPEASCTTEIPDPSAPVEVAVTIAVDTGGPIPFTAVGIGHAEPGWDAAAALADAVAAAAEAEVAIVMVGTDEEVECEGKDRTSINLPGRQDELVRAVLAANPATVVVVNAGAPVLMPWAGGTGSGGTGAAKNGAAEIGTGGTGTVPAVLWSWFGGQEYGDALADVLTGVAEPTGRLPTTLPATATATTVPATRPIEGSLPYAEGRRFGYRRYVGEPGEPAYWFGHGLGYTDWSYSPDPVVESDVDGSTMVRVRLRNTGERAGGEVVQVYASSPDLESTVDNDKVATGERPPARLVGFTVVYVDSGAEVDATIDIDAHALAGFVPGRGWAVSAGRHELTVGRSYADIRATAVIDISEPRWLDQHPTT